MQTSGRSRNCLVARVLLNVSFESRRTTRIRPGPGVLTYAVPVAAGRNITVEGRLPLTEQEWDQFLAVLQAMKPGLVAETSDDED